MILHPVLQGLWTCVIMLMMLNFLLASEFGFGKLGEMIPNHLHILCWLISMIISFRATGAITSVNSASSLCAYHVYVI
jgi:hypothetical protein